MKNDKLKGGLSDKLTEQDIADKFKIDIKDVNIQINKGIKVEMEHVNKESLAKEISMDHLIEIPDYYDRLEKMEKEGKNYWEDLTKLKENLKGVFKILKD